MLPPATAACRHRDLRRLRPAPVKADEKQREKAQEELAAEGIRDRSPSATCATSGRMRTSNFVERGMMPIPQRAQPCRWTRAAPSRSRCRWAIRPASVPISRWRAGCERLRHAACRPSSSTATRMCWPARARALGLAVPHRHDRQPCRGCGRHFRAPCPSGRCLSARQARRGHRRGDRSGDRSRRRRRGAGAGDEPHHQERRSTCRTSPTRPHGVSGRACDASRCTPADPGP